jgi:hypothetical protein
MEQPEVITPPLSDVSSGDDEGSIDGVYENVKNIHQIAIESVAHSVSSDTDICLLVNKFRASLGMSNSPKDTLSILFEDEILAQLLKAAVEKKVRFLMAKQKFNKSPVESINNNNTNTNSNNVNSNVNSEGGKLKSDNIAQRKKSRKEKNNIKIDTKSLEEQMLNDFNVVSSVDVVDGLISPNSVGTPREHDLEETHYDDDFDDVSFGSSDGSKRKVSFSTNIEVQVIPRLAEERIDECFYSEEEINQMYEESEQENNKDEQIGEVLV